MSNNSWVNHVREFAKQHNLTYMCAASTPECSKSYKEKQKPKAITAPVVAKTVAPKSESSSTNGNTFKVIDANHIPSGDKSVYIFFPFTPVLYKIVNVKKSPTGQTKKYIVDKYETSSWSTTVINNKQYAQIKFKTNVLMTREQEWKDLFYGHKRALMLKSCDFNKSLVVSLNEFQYNNN